MSRPTLTIIFDRSAFHADRFERIAKSALSALRKQGRIKVYHTPILLDETLSSYGAGERAKQWRDHLLYCLDVCDGIFLDRDEIWHNELVSGRGPFAQHLLPERPNKRYDSRPRLIETLRRKATSGDLSKEWADSAEMRQEARTKKGNQRAISKEIREIVAKAIKDRKVSGSVKDLPFSAFKSSDFLRTGRQLMDLVSREHAGQLGDKWARNPDYFPFYSAFVEGFLFNGYYAAAEHDQKLDKNAQPDYELLCYLTWADLVVSDDQGFFRRAFETIWAPRGKRIETADSFAELMDRLK